MYTNNLWLYYHFSKITKLQITNYIKVVGVCLSAAKNKSLLLYIIYILSAKKKIFFILIILIIYIIIKIFIL